MEFQFADGFSLTLFNFFCCVMLGLILAAFKKAEVSKKYIVGFVVYLIIFSLLVMLGAVKAKPIPFAPILFISVMVSAIIMAFSEAGKKLVSLPLAFLIGFQAFRLPLELILHQWAGIKTIPETMTWTGQNWDIVTGVISLLAIPFVNRMKALAWFVQIVGFGLLLNVLRVVIMSSPFPFSWQLDVPLQLIMYFPYALIGPLFVGPALCGHLLVFRKLRNSV